MWLSLHRGRYGAVDFGKKGDAPGRIIERIDHDDETVYVWLTKERMNERAGVSMSATYRDGYPSQLGDFYGRESSATRCSGGSENLTRAAPPRLRRREVLAGAFEVRCADASDGRPRSDPQDHRGNAA